jgi:hypothetical protein
MKKSIFATLLIGCLVAIVTSVSYANDVGKYYKVSDDKAFLSKTQKDYNDLSLELHKAILNPEPDEYMRQWTRINYLATPLPNHDLLPTDKLWLINCAIKQC